jgi:3-hydroxybutyryl-CoA dehydrogenase
VEPIDRIGVVSGGIMGAGIAEVSARAGADVALVEVDEARADAAHERIGKSLDRAARAGKLEDGERDEILKRITATADYSALAERQLVIEAVVENEGEKLKVFRRLDQVVADPDAVLASNTSSIPIMKLAMATDRRDKVIGMHFFNPVPVLNLVELIPSLLTSEDAQRRAAAFAAEQLGKKVIRSKDRAGFIVNALLIPYILDAIRMLESGFATAEDIDTGMLEGCSHPMGPLALADLIGLDTTKAVAESLYEEFKAPRYAPPPLLSRMVDAGLLGRKAGGGI